jgi:hypothetical protein
MLPLLWVHKHLAAELSGLEAESLCQKFTLKLNTDIASWVGICPIVCVSDD